MRKKMILAVLCAALFSLMISGCSGAEPVSEEKQTIRPESGSGDSQTEAMETTVGDSQTEAMETTVGTGQVRTRVYADGPYGQISVTVPANWKAEPVSPEVSGMSFVIYGLQLHPETEADSWIVLGYVGQFGVCGTGLEEETVTLAGDKAGVGTYDGKAMWDFVSFQGKNEGIAAQSVMAGGWSREAKEEVMTILDSLQFNREITSGGIGYDAYDASAEEFGLYVKAFDVSSTGLTLKFSLYDPEQVSGELTFGEAYRIERKNDTGWEALEPLMEIGFNDIGYLILPDPDSPWNAEWTVDWETAYGKLSPGDYRIIKSVHDLKAPGDYVEKEIFACFLLAGEN